MAVMSLEKILPMKNPGTETQNFLEGWEVNPRGIYVPPSAGERPVFVWHGAMHRGQTISLIADETTDPTYGKGSLYVGIVTENAIRAAAEQGRSKLDAYLEDTITPTEDGLCGAVEVLKILGALPVKLLL